jgi:CRP-like cAMP-binding protein
MALLDRAPRSATVRALSPVETYTLTADDFQQLLDRPPADERVRATARQRASQPDVSLGARVSSPPR